METEEAAMTRMKRMESPELEDLEAGSFNQMMDEMERQYFQDLQSSEQSTMEEA